MNIKLLTSLLLACFPLLAVADGNSNALSFAPPPGDFSVVFLSNIFGVVDGVLHGTGTQIMGAMFGVFNSAVLAIGGMIIMYTLIVSTLNTAHEGEVLGKEWSSIWIPLRSTLGLALLIPKASGYCLMQIMVMWVVVQGIGAADKVWDAALSYLNRGGVLVQAQQDPLRMITGGITEVAQGAARILTGQVCMLGIQKALENRRTYILKQKDAGTGPCAGAEAATNPLCKGPVPDFLSTVNVVSTQQDGWSSRYSVKMPNFDTDNDYQPLNGLCGTINWFRFPLPNGGFMQLTNDERETTSMSRAIAIQQMYLDLSTVTQLIVNNNPALNPDNNTGGTAKPPANFAPYAKDSFGFPLTAEGNLCPGGGDVAKCIRWGALLGSSQSPLFNGVEFQGAMLDYSAIMKPALSLREASNESNNANNKRKFIQTAQREGWAMAGSYFFDMVMLSDSSRAGPNMVDQETGMLDSAPIALGNAYSSGNGCTTAKEGAVCDWLGGSKTGVEAMTAIASMIDGSTQNGNPPKLELRDVIPKDFAALKQKVVFGAQAASVYGFINNSLMVQTPGQPGTQAPKFKMQVNIDVTTDVFQLPYIDFGCGNVKTFMFSFCLAGLLGQALYNGIVVTVFNYMLTYVIRMIDGVLIFYITIPLQAIAALFVSGIKSIQDPHVNPVVGLATMGINYINMSNQLWISILSMSIINILIIPFSVFMLPIMAFVMPLLVCWLGTMAGIGMVTAYYIPVLPYMIFTFGAIAWIMAVIEAMVAAPIVALGITHPEGHQAFGKGEPAIMILANVFLRPAMMIIGYLGAIALSFVSVWLINAGFTRAIHFMAGGISDYAPLANFQSNDSVPSPIEYTNWASIYAFFFSVLIYVTMYVTVVQKSYTLITYLPDKVLRWIGGTPETAGEQAAAWADEAKGKVESAGKESLKATGQGQAKMSEAITSKVKDMKKESGRITGEGGGGGGGGSSSAPAAPAG